MATRFSKRRKVEEPPSRSPTPPSPGNMTPLRPEPSPLTPDILEQRWARQKIALPDRRRSYDVSSSDHERQDSPDDLGSQAHTFWRDRRSRSRENGDRFEAEEGHGRERDDALMDRSSVTPIERPPDSPATKPMKPDRLYYNEMMTLRGHKRGVSAVRFSPDGKWIASCSADATIRIWETATGKDVRTLEGHLAGISTIAWSPDSKTLASGSDDKSIRLWDVATGKPYPSPLLGHHNYVYSIAFSPKGNMLVSGSYDEAVFLWDIRSARVMRSLPAHSDPVGGVDFVRDGTLIVSCAGDGLIRVWDTSTGQCLRTLVHEDNPPVSAVRFSPNGKYVLAWTLDSCIRLWDYTAGRCVKTYQGHTNQKFSTSGAFGTYEAGGQESAFAVSGSEDGAVVLWDVSDKNVLQKLEGHEGVVLGCDAMEVDGSGLIVTGGLDKTVRIWRMEREGKRIRNSPYAEQEPRLDRRERIGEGDVEPHADGMEEAEDHGRESAYEAMDEDQQEEDRGQPSP